MTKPKRDELTATAVARLEDEAASEAVRVSNLVQSQPRIRRASTPAVEQEGEIVLVADTPSPNVLRLTQSPTPPLPSTPPRTSPAQPATPFKTPISALSPTRKQIDVIKSAGLAVPVSPIGHPRFASAPGFSSQDTALNSGRGNADSPSEAPPNPSGTDVTVDVPSSARRPAKVQRSKRIDEEAAQSGALAKSGDYHDMKYFPLDFSNLRRAITRADTTPTIAAGNHGHFHPGFTITPGGDVRKRCELILTYFKTWTESHFSKHLPETECRRWRPMTAVRTATR
jgi:hypothetical protein